MVKEKINRLVLGQNIINHACDILLKKQKRLVNRLNKETAATRIKLPPLPYVVELDGYRSDNYVVVIINGSYCGVAKCNPIDNFNLENGLHIATVRAVSNLFKDAYSYILK